MKPGVIRIIGGSLRGRRIKVPDSEDLRPTPDRVRETLFNWLSPHLAGTRCLDLFAGSGVLGFEALSRGAAYVEMIDSSPRVIDHLKKTLIEFGGNHIVVIRQANVPAQLNHPSQPFDIIFIDPPYQQDLVIPCCQFLETHEFLAPSAYIYLEAHAPIHDNELPANWRLLKEGRAGQVYYHLALREVKKNGK
jgi:16S rRNA (guanine966-N2)-methyltransferase